MISKKPWRDGQDQHHKDCIPQNPANHQLQWGDLRAGPGMGSSFYGDKNIAYISQTSSDDPTIES